MRPEQPDPEGGLSPADEERVRRLLTAAGGPVTAPEEVTARLDEALAGLRAERTPADHGGVGDLARRRRRRWPALLAAAAVAVAGVGIGLGTLGQGGGADSMSANTAADAGGAEAAPETVPSDTGDRAGEPAPSGDGGSHLLSSRTSRLPKVRTGSATLDAQRILALSLGAAPAQVQRGSTEDQDTTGCRLPAVSPGERLVAVRLDGERASLLFRTVVDGRRDAEVYSCEDGESPVLVTTVDAP